MIKTLGIGVMAAVMLFAQQRTLPPEEQRSVDQQLADPRLDQGLRVTLKLTAVPIKDVLTAIAESTGLRIRYDQTVPELDRSVTVNIVNVSVTEALATFPSVNGLAFKVTGPRSVFFFSDTAANRQKFVESIRAFEVKKADPIALISALQQTFQARDGIRPTFITGRSGLITVRATSDKMAEIEKFIAANDKD